MKNYVKKGNLINCANAFFIVILFLLKKIGNF